MQYELHSTYMLSSAFYPPSAFSHPRFILHPHFLIRVLSSIRIFSSAFYPPSAFSHPRFILHPHFLIRVLSSIRIFSSAYYYNKQIPFCDNGEKMCQFCTLIFLLKLINFLKKDFPRRGPVFCQGGPGPPGPRPSYASGEIKYE